MASACSYQLTSSRGRRSGSSSTCSTSSPAASRSRAPSRRRSRSCSTAVRARAAGARVRDRHAPSLPGDARALARGRAPLRHEDRGLRGRRPVEEGLWDTNPDLYLAVAQDRAAQPGAARSRRLDHRDPPRPVTGARRRAEARLGLRPRALEGEPARRLDRRRLLGATSASASCRTTRSTTRATSRSADRHSHAARQGARRSLGGPERTECGLHT